MQKKFAVIGLSAGLVGGSLAGLVITVPGLAGAESTGTVVVQGASAALDQSTDTTTPSTDTTDTARPARGQWMQDALAGLVTDGTLTQEQADKVIAALEAARPAGGRGGKGMGGMRGGGAGLEAAATAIGVTAEELHTALHEGKSIADVATEKGVAVDTVVAAMVQAAKDRLAQGVTDGKLTQEEADARAADLETRITEAVNTAGEPRGMGMGRGGRHGQADDAPAADDATTSTTQA